MPTYPWRFQADLAPGYPDPEVTVFVGDTVVNEVTGEKSIARDTTNPEIVRLSDLSSYLASAATDGIVRKPKPAAPG